MPTRRSAPPEQQRQIGQRPNETSNHRVSLEPPAQPDQRGNQESELNASVEELRQAIDGGPGEQNLHRGRQVPNSRFAVPSMQLRDSEHPVGAGFPGSMLESPGESFDEGRGRDRSPGTR